MILGSFSGDNLFRYLRPVPELSYGLRQRIEEKNQKEYAITQENIVAHCLKL